MSCEGDKKTARPDSGRDSVNVENLTVRRVDQLLRVGMSLEDVERIFGRDYYLDKSDEKWVMDYIFKDLGEDMVRDEVIGLSVYLVDEEVTLWATELFGAHVESEE